MSSDKIIKIENFSFQYPTSEAPNLKNINLELEEGEFAVLCGSSGSGKTSLLRQLKPALAPFGEKSGQIYYRERKIDDLNLREETQKIGFVLQKPQNQVVTDKVWHEMAFGLESLGYKSNSIRQKVGEMAGFFGIEDWFYKKVTELSGGQLQILSLASIMALHPEILILDEPTSQLDPIAAGKFINLLKRINTELGTTIFLSEHRLSDVIPVSDRIIILKEGRISFDGKAEKLGKYFSENNDDMFYSMPPAIRICAQLGAKEKIPVNINQGRKFILEYTNGKKLEQDFQEPEEIEKKDKITLKEVFFRYKKSSADVIKGIDLNLKESEIFAILGGNGSGKTTILKLISRLETAQRGKILIDGKDIKKLDDKNFYGKKLSLLPQNPQNLFLKNTVREDYMDLLPKELQDTKEGIEKIDEMLKEMDLSNLANSHPYDLSGGEQQRMALGKILLNDPEIILMDEPTKGMDGFFKKTFIEILLKLKARKKTILIVSHDIEFCANAADRCALLFKGEIINTDKKRDFFSGNYFYSTAANKMMRRVNDKVITVKEAVELLRRGDKREERSERGNGNQ